MQKKSTKVESDVRFKANFRLLKPVSRGRDFFTYLRLLSMPVASASPDYY